MNYRLLSDIINSAWLIDKERSMSYAPLLMALLNNGGPDPAPENEDHSTQRELNRSYVYSKTNTVSYWDFSDTNIPDGSIAIIPLRGEIMKYSQMCGPRGTLEKVADIKSANENPRIKSILMIIDSPGGQVAHTDILADAVKNSTKPIIAFVEGMAASAAYWIISGSTKIIASSNIDRIGSIGTMLYFADVRGYYEEMGVKFHEIYATKSIDKNKDTNQVLKGEYDEYRTSVLDTINDKFHASVTTNRKRLSKETLTGKLYFADQAIKLGLIDEIGTMDYALEQADAIEPEEQMDTDSIPSPDTQISTNMKIKVQAAWAAINSFFRFDSAKENTIDEAQISELNNELQSRGDKITQLTADLETARTSQQTAESNLATETASRQTAETNLQTANSRVTELETENNTLRSLPGAQTALAKSDREISGENGVDADNEYAKSHTSAEFVEYYNNKYGKK